jgi:hypothetical protein
MWLRESGVMLGWPVECKKQCYTCRYGDAGAGRWTGGRAGRQGEFVEGERWDQASTLGSTTEE